METVVDLTETRYTAISDALAKKFAEELVPYISERVIAKCRLYPADCCLTVKPKKSNCSTNRAFFIELSSSQTLKDVANHYVNNIRPHLNDFCKQFGLSSVSLATTFTHNKTKKGTYRIYGTIYVDAYAQSSDDTSPEQNQWNLYCKDYGFKPSDWGQPAITKEGVDLGIFYYIKPNYRTYPIIVKRGSKMIKFSCTIFKK